MQFRTGTVEATPRNLADIPAMITHELNLFGADTSGIKTPKELQAGLEENPEQYLGTFDDTDRLVAFAKFNDWRKGDQIAFDSLAKQIKYHFSEKERTVQILPGNPMGIFALNSYAGLAEDDAVHASELLLDDIIAVAEGREIRIARFYHDAAKDPAWWATNHRNFRETGQFSHYGGVLQQLAVRPAKPAPKRAA